MINSGPIVIFGEKSAENNSILYVKEEDFQILAGEESFGNPLEFLMGIEKSKINSKSFLENFQFSDFSLWWFIHPSVYPKIKKCINFIEKFEEFLSEKKPSKIIVSENFSNIDLIEQISHKHRIKLEKNFSTNIKNKFFNKFKPTFQNNRYQKIHSKKTEKRKTMFQSKSIPDIQKKIIFAIPTIYHRKIIDHKTGESYFGEYIQQPIIDHVMKNHNIIGIDFDYTFDGEFNVLDNRLNSEIDWIPSEMLLSDLPTKILNDFLNKYNNLISEKEFQQLFVYREISLWSSISYTFKMMTFSSYIPSYIHYLISLENYFKEHKPKTIFLSYETGPYGLAMILAAEKNNIKTIGVAHGAIDKFNPMYSYDQIRNKNFLLGFPIPDITLVHGEFSKNTMVSQGYPSNQILVYGNPTFFNLHKLKNSLSQKNLFEKYNIKKSQKVILYGTEFLQEKYSAQGKYNYNSLIWKILLENFGNNSEYELILKPHPNENIEIYKKILDDSSVNNARIISDDLFELIHISSIVISVFSNIMTDALCFEKPVIRVTFDNIKHTVPYEKFNVVLSSNLNELSNNVKRILSDQSIISDLQKNLPAFLLEQNNIPENNPNSIIDKILD
ncbi:CDP-glycerol glycerophosphotransferase family protein [Nitrosopumilus sp.]|uniref:CDP-glycerol glycerophosphotransferase family protein n=1 Tax=Nitrosopumilus sp. TaxID=2024843 RepID=UPI00247CBFB5|nr:CDP-glycerol glycerophosphotransferase family protein [Nitrosopumilus sp.]MCV0430374.1 CDP-glycerol glycerophosphotransferase family protein [Nitrosopumilus sp.]